MEHEASATEEDTTKLELTLRPHPNEVSIERECVIKVNNQLVKLTTKEYYEEYELRQRCGTNTKFGSQAIVVKVDKETREKLNTLESHVKLMIPDSWEYKPLYTGEDMTINISRYCKYYFYDDVSKPKKAVVNSDTEFKQGHYRFTIWVKNLYVGPHQNGENCSLSLQVVELYYWADKEAIRKERESSPWCESAFRLC